jgi:hypothetical protein
VEKRFSGVAGVILDARGGVVGVMRGARASYASGGFSGAGASGTTGGNSAVRAAVDRLMLGARWVPVEAVANSSSAVRSTPMRMIPPQTEHRARTPPTATLAGSTRNTDRHSEHETFTSSFLPYGRGWAASQSLSIEHRIAFLQRT